SKMHATTVTYATIKDLVAKKQFDIALKIFKTSLEPHMPYDLSILETSYSKMYEDVMNMLSEITKNGTFNEKHIAKEIIQERALYAIDQTFDPNEEITRACHFFYTEFHTL